MNRRDILTTITGGLIVTAGCLSSIDPNNETDDGVILKEFTIGNFSYTPRTVAVVLLYDNEPVLSQVYDIDAREGNVAGGRKIDIPHRQDPVKVEIRAAMDDQIEVEYPLDNTTNKCADAVVMIAEGGVLDILSEPFANGCSGSTPEA